VSLSFVSFFIDYKSAAARAPLGATSVLTVTNLVAGKSNNNIFLLKKKTTKFSVNASLLLL
jgi:hypothetical protein